MLFTLQTKWDKVILGKAKLRQKVASIKSLVTSLQLAHAEAKYTELLVEMKNVKQENLKLKQRLDQFEKVTRDSEVKHSRASALVEEEKKSR
jgi:regulator of replication initiation timing